MRNKLDLIWFDLNAETVSHTLVSPYYVIIANTRYRATSARKGQAIIGHSLLHRLDI